jgi:hypothetical protein
VLRHNGAFGFCGGKGVDRGSFIKDDLTRNSFGDRFMDYIFSPFNFGMLCLAVFASGVLFFCMSRIYYVRVARCKKTHPESHEQFADKLNTRMDRQWAIISALFVVIAVVAMVKNVPNRTEQLQKAAALVKLTSAVDSITERRFGERCAFNGASVDSSWVETDTFPCVSIANHRIWAKGATQINRDSVAIRRAFVIGRVQSDQSISRLAEIDFESGRSSTKMKSDEIAALTEALTR